MTLLEKIITALTDKSVRLIDTYSVVEIARLKEIAIENAKRYGEYDLSTDGRQRVVSGRKQVMGTIGEVGESVSKILFDRAGLTNFKPMSDFRKDPDHVVSDESSSIKIEQKTMLGTYDELKFTYWSAINRSIREIDFQFMLVNWFPDVRGLLPPLREGDVNVDGVARLQDRLVSSWCVPRVILTKNAARYSLTADNVTGAILKHSLLPAGEYFILDSSIRGISFSLL